MKRDSEDLRAFEAEILDGDDLDNVDRLMLAIIVKAREILEEDVTSILNELVTVYGSAPAAIDALKNDRVRLVRDLSYPDSYLVVRTSYVEKPPFADAFEEGKDDETGQ
jgi:hypothetical protein